MNILLVSTNRNTPAHAGDARRRLHRRPRRGTFRPYRPSPGPDVHRGRDGRGGIGREGLPTRPGRRLGAQHRQQRHAEHGVLPGRPAGDRQRPPRRDRRPDLPGRRGAGSHARGNPSPWGRFRLRHRGRGNDLSAPGRSDLTGRELPRSPRESPLSKTGPFAGIPLPPGGFGRVSGAGLSSMAEHEGLPVSSGDGPDPDQDRLSVPVRVLHLPRDRGERVSLEGSRQRRRCRGPARGNGTPGYRDRGQRFQCAPGTRHERMRSTGTGQAPGTAPMPGAEPALS